MKFTRLLSKMVRSTMQPFRKQPFRKQPFRKQPSTTLPFVKRHAIVIGGSMTGLLASRILADYFQQVTIIERDTYPLEPNPRRGIPQSRFLHVLLQRGQLILEELFPGLTDELVSYGAPLLNDAQDICFFSQYGTAKKEASSIRTISPTRGLLDWTIRRRLLQRSNIQFLDGGQVTSLVRTPDQKGIGGVHLQTANGDQTMMANLVIDASGKTSKAPQWLQALGYEAPEETFIDAQIGYVHRMYEQPDNPAVEWKAAVVWPSLPEQTRSAILFPVEGDCQGHGVAKCEGHGVAKREGHGVAKREGHGVAKREGHGVAKREGHGVAKCEEHGVAKREGHGVAKREGHGVAKRWLVGLGGAAPDYPPTNEAEFLEYARSLPTPDIYNAIKDAKPLSDPYMYRGNENRLRAYEQLAVYPENFLVMGHAACAFNPVYGQGMTMAAIESQILDRALSRLADTPRPGWCRRIQKQFAKAEQIPWSMATEMDQQYIKCNQIHSFRDRCGYWYQSQLLKLMIQDAEVYERMMRVNHMLDKPTSLSSPVLLWKILAHSVRTSIRHRRSAKGTVIPV